MVGKGGVVWMDMVGILQAYTTHRLKYACKIPTISLTWVLRNGGRPPVKADKRGRLEGQESRQHAHLVLRRIKSALASRRERAKLVLLAQVRVKGGPD